jgi:hypothetical protein
MKIIDLFGGNKHGEDIFEMFRVLLHTWDDLVDKDVDVSEDQINEAFRICLIKLPTNPLYNHIFSDIVPMWEVVISAYVTANKFEREKDEHGIEISHSLRYAAGHIVAYAIIQCVGIEKSKELIPLMWKEVFYERFDDYKKEHLT